ncbi:MAG: Bro-N domain-containing protein [Dysgonomonas sp.]
MENKQPSLHKSSLEANMPMQIFKYESEEAKAFDELRTIETPEGKILFGATDVAKMLGYGNPNDAIIRHCKSDGIVIHEVIDLLGRKQSVKFVSEGNVYRLIVKSQLPSAERFETWLFDEVIPSIRSKGYYGKIDRVALPNFMIRYKDNLHKIERGYFSVISELFVTLGTELSKYGYDIPDKGVDGKGLYPDISVGKSFANYLKKINHPHKDKYKTYKHSFSDDRFDCDARMYHLDLLPAFRNFVLDEWVPNFAHNYFSKKDPKALEYLPKLLGK